MVNVYYNYAINVRVPLQLDAVLISHDLPLLYKVNAKILQKICCIFLRYARTFMERLSTPS